MSWQVEDPAASLAAFAALGDALGIGLLGGFRNKLMNPQHDIWQIASPKAGAGWASDGWYISGGGTFTASRVTAGLPLGCVAALRMTQGAAASYGNIHQALESRDVDVLQGRKVTFLVKLRRNASFSSALLVRIQKNATPDTMTGGSWSTLQTQTVANADLPTGTGAADWYTAKVVADVPDDGTAEGLRVMVEVSSAQGSGTYYETTDAQLVVGDASEQGDDISPLRPYAVELELCQRHFEVITISAGGYAGVGQAYSTSAMIWPLRYRPKRVAPVVTVPTGIVPLNAAGTGQTVSSHLADSASLDACRVLTSVTGTPLVAGNACLLYSSAGGAITVDARFA